MQVRVCREVVRDMHFGSSVFVDDTNGAISIVLGTYTCEPAAGPERKLRGAVCYWQWLLLDNLGCPVVCCLNLRRAQFDFDIDVIIWSLNLWLRAIIAQGSHVSSQLLIASMDLNASQWLRVSDIPTVTSLPPRSVQNRRERCFLTVEIICLIER